MENTNIAMQADNTYNATLTPQYHDNSEDFLIQQQHAPPAIFGMKSHGQATDPTTQIQQQHQYQHLQQDLHQHPDPAFPRAVASSRPDARAIHAKNGKKPKNVTAKAPRAGKACEACKVSFA